MSGQFQRRVQILVSLLAICGVIVLSREFSGAALNYFENRLLKFKVSEQGQQWFLW